MQVDHLTPGEGPLLSVRDVGVRFATPRGSLLAVDGVSFDLHRHRTLGIVGESGSGKSVLVRTVLGLHASNVELASETSIQFDGQELVERGRVEASHLWGRRVAMIFQDPMTSLNPVRRIGSQLTEAMRKHLGLSRKEAMDRAGDLLEEVGISDPRRRLQQHAHELSGGMRQRVMIAMALACEPELLVADEPTTALDVTVQRQVLELLHDVQQRHGMAMIFISHDLGVISEVADEVAVMYAGQIVEQAEVRALFDRVSHPYTEALLRSMPRIDDGRHVRLEPIPGQLPDMTAPPLGCRFAARCRYASPACAVRPDLVPHGDDGRLCRCVAPVDYAPMAAV